MSQKYIATQKIKGQKIIFKNLQTKNDKSQIDFHRINAINNLQSNYNFVKEYLKSREKKDNKQTKESSLGNSKVAQNLRKGAINLKKKILTIKTNSESNEQLKKKSIQIKIEPANYKSSFTHEINMSSNCTDNIRKKRNANTNNHVYYISNNKRNGHSGSYNNKNAIYKDNINKKNEKGNMNGNDNDKNANNNKNTSSLPKSFKKYDFKYLIDSIKKSHEKIFEEIRTNNKNIVDMITNSFKEMEESQKKRDSEVKEKKKNAIYNFMSLIRYDRHIFLTELEKKQNKLVQDMFEKQKKLIQDRFVSTFSTAETLVEKQRDENLSLLRDFVLNLN